MLWPSWLRAGNASSCCRKSLGSQTNIQYQYRIAHAMQYATRDDLDLIVTLTNVAAVTNQMALLCCHRLARAQVASMSSPVTTGLGNNDYFLSAEFNESDDAAAHYTETLCRIPGTVRPKDPPQFQSKPLRRFQPIGSLA